MFTTTWEEEVGDGWAWPTRFRIRTAFSPNSGRRKECPRVGPRKVSWMEPVYSSTYFDELRPEGTQDKDSYFRREVRRGSIA